MHLNYSNVCVFDCHFCSFYRKDGAEGAWEMDLDTIFAYAAKSKFEKFPVFNFEIPTAIPGVDANLLNPRNTWTDKKAYDDTLKKLAGMFAEKFKRFADNDAGRDLMKFGPQV